MTEVHFGHKPEPQLSATQNAHGNAKFTHRVLKKIRAKWMFWSGKNRIIRSGIRNVVTLNDALLRNTCVEFVGNDNRLEILDGTRCWGVSFKLVGNGQVCRIGANSRLHGGSYILEDTGSRLQIGSGSTLWSPLCVVQEGGSISIGSDCLVATGTHLMNSDAHSILDKTTRERINPAKNILVADHVWIGAQAQILKGVEIGTGAIVASRSTVTKNVPAGNLVAGVPARVLKENIDWDARRL